jgi:hypothetical protein
MSTNPETPQNTERPLQQDGEPASPQGQEMALQSGKKTITYVDYFLQLHFGESEDAARTSTCCAVKKVLTGMDIENQEDIDDIDSQCILDVCSSDEKLSFMDGTRTRKFLSKIGHPGFLSETLSSEIFDISFQLLSVRGKILSKKFFAYSMTLFPRAEL